MTEREIFVAAVEINDPARRSAYLESACGEDADLLRKVQSLLVSHKQLSRFLEIPIPQQLAEPQSGDNPATQIVSNNSTHNESHVASQTDAAGASCATSKQVRSDDEILLGLLQPSARPESLGRLSHYEILEVLGRGAFGTVLRAFDDKLQRVVAIKMMAPEIAATSPARKRFLREAQTAAAIRHEHVVSIYAVEEAALPYLVMEYVAGQTLQQRLDEVGPLDVPEVLRIGRQIAEGLDAAHSKNLIHRDVKPGNILLEAGVQNRVIITDFGLARAADDASLTQSGTIAGTPLYMAPEQALGQKFDQRVDLFSLGSVLYQMVSGRPPFRASSALAVLKRVVEDTPRPIREIIPETPDWICNIISKLQAKNPDDRYQSARELAQVLGRCETQLNAGTLVFESHLESRGARGQWKRWVALAGCLLSVIAIVSWLLTSAKRQSTKTARQLDASASQPDGSGREQVDHAENPRTLGNQDEPATPGSLAVTANRTDKMPPLAVAPFDAEQAMSFQEAWAKFLDLPVEFTNSIGMRFRLIPPGEFMMGAGPEELERALSHASDWNRDSVKSEGPARLVRIRRPCYLGAYPVTVGDFRRFVDATDHETTAETNGIGALGWSQELSKMAFAPENTWQKPEFVVSEKLPVVCMTYRDAVAFCNWLSANDGLHYDIPHESVWEFACRAGTTSLWYWGSDPESWGHYTHGGTGRYPVGEKPPNAFGLFDMLGNAEEIARADHPALVQRGGSGLWMGRSAQRQHMGDPFHPPQWNVGFRVAIVGDLKRTVSPPH